MPNAERAVVDTRKLRDYCLSADHPRGRHKARVFQSVLGFTSAGAEDLRQRLIEAASSNQAMAGERDDYGERYSVETPMVGPAGQGVIRSLWIVRAGEDFPRFVSCYVMR